MYRGAGMTAELTPLNVKMGTYRGRRIDRPGMPDRWNQSGGYTSLLVIKEAINLTAIPFSLTRQGDVAWGYLTCVSFNALRRYLNT
jgi:hypothetical protein